METGIRLITRGDDAGFCHSANVAFEDAARNGILRNISVIVPGPAFEDAVAMLGGIDGACWGLHGTITAEWDQPRWGPVLPPEQVPTLVGRDGLFHRTTQELHERKPSHAEILAELQAQLDKARQAGLAIEYIDEHMAYGWFEGLQAKLHDFARREGLIYGRDTVNRLPDVDGHFETKADHFLARLRKAGPGTYLHVIHPGCNDEEMRQLGSRRTQPGQVARDREQDRLVFTSQAVLDYVRDNQIEIVRYTDVMKP